MPENAPAWICRAALKAGWPVVVRTVRPADPCAGGHRRARPGAGTALGRLDRRDSGITRRLRPEALGQRGRRCCAICRPGVRLRDLRAPLNALGLAWGVTGGAGFELASGVTVLHPDSDLDLLLRTPRPFPRDDALRLLQCFEQCPCRIDLQLQTPAGGVALREWAEGRPRVLAKGSEAPLLLEDPWRIAEVEA
nr:malonate decarboxylase holo-ACP synthase [Pseudomonas aeruginosa]